MESPPPHAKRQRSCQDLTEGHVILSRRVFECWAGTVTAVQEKRSRHTQLADDWHVKIQDSWQAAMEGVYWCSTCYDTGCCHGEGPCCSDICRDTYLG
jgi:hypothetical protein